MTTYLLDNRGADVGLTQVTADAAFPVASAASALGTANVTQVRDQLVAQGPATAAEIDAHLAAVAAGETDVATPPLVSAWGRRREEQPCAS